MPEDKALFAFTSSCDRTIKFTTQQQVQDRYYYKPKSILTRILLKRVFGGRKSTTLPTTLRV